MIHLIACAHGTHSADSRTVIDTVRYRMQQLLEAREPGGYRVHEAYVDVQDPRVGDVMAECAGERAVIVPLLLSTGYHTQVDLYRAAKISRTEMVPVADALGPSPVLARLLRSRLEEAGWRDGQPVVLAGAGSSRADGQAAVASQTRLLSDELGQPVDYGFIADIEPRIEHKAASGVFVANYLMGPGFFHSRLSEAVSAAGGVLAQPLGVAGDSHAADVLARCALDSMMRAI